MKKIIIILYFLGSMSVLGNVTKHFHVKLVSLVGVTHGNYSARVEIKCLSGASFQNQITVLPAFVNDQIVSDNTEANITITGLTFPGEAFDLYFDILICNHGVLQIRIYLSPFNIPRNDYYINLIAFLHPPAGINQDKGIIMGFPQRINGYLFYYQNNITQFSSDNNNITYEVVMNATN